MNRLKKLKKIRLHREGTEILIASALLLAGINALVFWAFDCKILFYLLATASIIIYLLMVNFFRCPIRLFEHDTEKVVVAPADGRIVVIEEVDEHEYFHDRRLMISIFMSIVNVHANWYPVDGVVKHVDHHNGKFMKAWLPKPARKMNVPWWLSRLPKDIPLWRARLPEPSHAVLSLRRSRRRLLH